MGVLTIEKEITSSHPQAKLFKVFVLESHVYICKMVPDVIVEFIEGNGDTGSIKKITFPQGEFKHMTVKIDSIDKDNFTHSHTILGGEPWQDGLEKITYDIKIEASPNGGSIVKSIAKYYKKEGHTLDEGKIKNAEESAFAFFKGLEAYISANPDA